MNEANSPVNLIETEDTRALAWPAVSRVLRTGSAPNARDQQVLDLLDDWVGRDAPLIDADDNGTYDEAGPTVMSAMWSPVANAVVQARPRAAFGFRRDGAREDQVARADAYRLRLLPPLPGHGGEG